VTVQASAQCGDTLIHEGALYACISYYSNPDWDCGGTVSCTNTSPTHVPYGDDAWEFVMSCD
jgi:hypothetical protein